MTTLTAEPNPSTEATPLLQDESRCQPQEQQGEAAAVNGALGNGDVGNEEDANSEGPDENDKIESPYLGGVSKTKFWLIFGGVLLQYFVACFDSTLMASSHPVITSHFHSSQSASWLSTAFLLTLTTSQPLLARFSDTLGRRPIYLFSLAVFTLTTLWCALAPTIGSFIAARAVAGIGAGGVLAMGSVMTNDLVPMRVRGTYQAYINLFYGLGQACGAAFGGYLCDTLGWRWTFGVQIPAILSILVLASITTPSNLGPQLAKTSAASQNPKGVFSTIDIPGSLLLTTATATLILGLNLGGNILPWTHPLIALSLFTCLLSTIFLIHTSRRATHPILPLRILTTSPRANLIFSNFFGNVGNNTVLFNAPLFFQAVLLDSPSASGFRLAFPSLAVMVFGVSSGFIMTYTRRIYPLIVVGSLVALAGTVALACMWDGIPAWLATLFIVPVSTGLGLSYPATSLAVLVESEKGEQAVVTGTLSLWRSLGAVVGIIERVRKSVRAILDLDPLHQRQGSVCSIQDDKSDPRPAVIQAYEHSLRNAFIFAIACFVLVNALVFPIKLPRLGRK
ncbi:MFS general substrate transporter [Saccharata proteae CBS 121410]|uniref:MFS general substrate transporter n=1 Tax=Saccharata proteae CBS 121410 TaxID=1314787 RepID=A0A9P4LV36_9PEZI|nr:MFS general substrate transporter [Saccharata proteae CBS 121410]